MPADFFSSLQACKTKGTWKMLLPFLSDLFANSLCPWTNIMLAKEANPLLPQLRCNTNGVKRGKVECKSWILGSFLLSFYLRDSGGSLHVVKHQTTQLFSLTFVFVKDFYRRNNLFTYHMSLMYLLLSFCSVKCLYLIVYFLSHNSSSSSFLQLHMNAQCIVYVSGVLLYLISERR